jgi:chromate transporter
MISWPTYFWLLLKASLFSTGGMGNLPSLHSDMIARGWATEADFGESLAIGQISPGPSGLWVISFGYLTGGVRGSMLATLAIVLPPLLIVAVDRLYSHVHEHPAVEGFVRGLGVSVVGIFVVVLYGLLHGVGIDARTLSITVAAIVLMASKRVPVVVILGLAGVGGVMLR